MAKTNLINTNFICRNKRLEIPGLVESILGGLAYLADTQVDNNKTYKSKTHNFFIYAKSKNAFKSRIIGRLRSYAGRSVIGERHIEGSWPSTVRFLPLKGSGVLKPLFTATDYNLCSTIGAAYSLLLFDDSLLPPDKRFVSTMLERTYKAVTLFKRDNAYNFWKTQISPEISYPYSTPINIPLSIIDLRRSIYERTGLLGLGSFYESDVLIEWINRIYNKKENKLGSISLFNIPNDSDNTSMAVGFLLQYQKWKKDTIAKIDLSPLDLYPSFRDINRKSADRYNICLGQDTGSFLTWLKDENSYVFSDPEQGIIPLSINNVDIVINANILFALSLSDRKTFPGFTEAVKLMAKVIEKDIWMKASLYYPENMFFAYTVSRAVRDAGLWEPEINKVLPVLLESLFDEQEGLKKNNSGPAGAFSGLNTESIYLATALALITLLNIGRSVAEENGMVKKYDETIENGIRFLIAERKPDKFNNSDTAKMFAGITPNYWESGLLYSSSVQLLSHWYSNPHTTSLVVEALTKYLMEYDTESELSKSIRPYLFNDEGRINLRLYKI